MRIRILRDFDLRVEPAVTLAFRAGTEDDRPRVIAEQLIAAGAAEPIKTTRKPPKE